MPLKRTPPKGSPHHHHSDSDIAALAFADADPQREDKVSDRPRPRKRTHDEDISASLLELKKSMEILSCQQSSLQTSIKEIQTQNQEIIKSMEFISAQYDEMKNKITKLESERKDHLAYIQTLQMKVENLERSQKQASIEICNLPPQVNEKKDDLVGIVEKIGETLNVNLEKTQIYDIFRIPTKSPSRPIIVEFSSVLLKEKMISSLKTFNKSNNIKLNTSHLKLGGDIKPIFIRERLTETARRMYYLSREFSKENDFMFCWTAHGKVYLRKREGAPAIRIDTKEDLLKLLPQVDK
ncbi:uncharacterized protein LOC121729528 [Aricia agestis]|uniref:uncharacterized protein LOC121729528 n=1 Tax=Aricia agestis TaxID=91739 RepID=UPI001C207970|nr:uncharacterized protein LOC121729528 [Aricia agestis]